MVKQIIALIALSIVIILSMSHVQQALTWIIAGYDWVSQTLTEVFSGGTAGNLIRNLLALLAIPILLAAVPVFIYWLAKRQWFPYFMEVVWVTWLVQTSILIIQYKVAT